RRGRSRQDSEGGGEGLPRLRALSQNPLLHGPPARRAPGPPVARFRLGGWRRLDSAEGEGREGPARHRTAEEREVPRRRSRGVPRPPLARGRVDPRGRGGRSGPRALPLVLPVAEEPESPPAQHVL